MFSCEKQQDGTYSLFLNPPDGSSIPRITVLQDLTVEHLDELKSIIEKARNKKQEMILNVTITKTSH